MPGFPQIIKSVAHQYGALHQQMLKQQEEERIKAERERQLGILPPQLKKAKLFTPQTNPRFAYQDPKFKDDLTHFKKMYSERIKKDGHLNTEEKKDVLKHIHNAEDFEDFKDFTSVYPQIPQFLKHIEKEKEKFKLENLRGAIARDIFEKNPDKSFKLKPGKDLPADADILSDSYEKLRPYAPKGLESSNLRKKFSKEYKDLKFNFDRIPKFKDEQQYKDFLESKKSHTKFSPEDEELFKEASFGETEKKAKSFHKGRKFNPEDFSEEAERAHEEKVFRDALNPDREAQNAPPVSETDKKPFKNYMPTFPAFSNIANLEQTHGTPAEQQVQHAILEKAVDDASQPYEPFNGQRVAGRDPLESLALDKILQNSPSSVKNLAHHKTQRKRLEALSKFPKQSEVAAPYLEASAGNPLDVFKDRLDRDVLQKIGFIHKDMDKKFEEDYLPRIERVNKIGPAKYGSVGKALERATSEHQKNKLQAIREALLESNRTALQAGQTYLGHQANLGEIAAKNATAERGDEERATHFLAQQHQNEQNEKEKYIAHLSSEGAINRAREQQVLNENYNEADRAKQHSYTQLTKLLNLKSRMPQVATAYTSKANIQPPVNRPNFNQALGGGFFNMGANQFFGQQQAQQASYMKKGGVVRLKKAQGGIIGDAVENAVIEHSSPLYELKRLINKNNLMDISQTKIGKRRKYNTGGSVDPIKAGALQAMEFKEKDNLKNYLSQRENVQPENRMSSMMHDFMIGAAQVGGDNFLGRAGNAYKESYAHKAAQREAAENKKFQSLMAQYQIEGASRKEAQEAIKQDREEKYKNKLLNYQQANLDKQTAMMEHHFKKNENSNKNKIDEIDKDIYKKTNQMYLTANEKIKELKRMKELLGKINTGLGATSWTGRGTIAEKKEYDSLVEKIFGKNKGPNRSLPKEAAINLLDGEINTFSKQVQLFNFINESYKQGIPPKDALFEFEKNNPNFNFNTDNTETTVPITSATSVVSPTSTAPAEITEEKPKKTQNIDPLTSTYQSLDNEENKLKNELDILEGRKR